MPMVVSESVGALHELTATTLRHPLASRKFIIEFNDPTGAPTPSVGGGVRKKCEPFELLSQYTAEYPIAKGTYGYVICARDSELLAAFQSLPADEKLPPEDSGLDATTFCDLKTTVAIKKVPGIFEANIPRLWLCAAREAQMLLHFNHENVISASDIFIPLCENHLMTAESLRQRQRTFEDVYVVMQRKDYTLRQVMSRFKISESNETVSEGEKPKVSPITGEALCPVDYDYRQFMLYQIIRGVGYLHKCGVTHRDLKPENVLVDVDYKCSLCDFGQARDFSFNEVEDSANDVNATHLYNCTQWYAAPETLSIVYEDLHGEGVVHPDAMHSIDMWSVGAIAAELMIGRPIFHTRHSSGEAQLLSVAIVCGPISDSESSAMSDMRNKEVQSLYKTKYAATNLELRNAKSTTYADVKEFLRGNCPRGDATEDEIDLVAALLSYDPIKRPTPAVALEHRYFRDAGYESEVDPRNTAAALRTIRKEELLQESQGRTFFWNLFMDKHPMVRQLMEVLEKKEERARGGA